MNFKYKTLSAERLHLFEHDVQQAFLMGWEPFQPATCNEYKWFIILRKAR